jgi:hypothetical protein
VTFFRRFDRDLSTDELMAMVFDSPHAEVRSAAAGCAARDYAKWSGDKTAVRRLLPALDSEDGALRNLAVKVVLSHRYGDPFLRPRQVLAKLDSPHKEVRDAVREFVSRQTATDDAARNRYYDEIGPVTARKLNAMQNRADVVGVTAAPRPWVLPAPRPPQAAVAVVASDAPSAGWLTGLTAALGVALVATFGTLFAVAKFTTPIIPPPPPVEYSEETPGWMRRAA